MNRPEPSYHAIPVPRLETERLILRGPLASDWDALCAFSTDAERTRFLGGPAESDNAVWRTFIGVIGHWVWHGYGMWMLEEKASGQPAGRIGLINHVGWPEPELGWHIFAGFEGKGLAFEAAAKIRDYACDTFGLDRLVSYVDAGNTRSRALAERLGATIESEGEIMGHPCLVYRHPSVKREVA